MAAYNTIIRIEIFETRPIKSLQCDFCGKYSIEVGYEYQINFKGISLPSHDCICPECIERLKRSHQELEKYPKLLASMRLVGLSYI